MIFSRRHLLMFAFWFPLAFSVMGCSKPEAKAPEVKPGNMPEAGEWTGVYYNPVFGHLHLVKEGNTISGKWRTTAGDKWGELSGEVVGDLLRYQWQEHVIGAVGASAGTGGHGYFRYVVPKGTNVDHEIHGEWGLNAEEAGQKWDAIKQRNQKPDPTSVMPDETQSVSGDSWDESKKEKKPAPVKKDSASSDDDWE
jgi:hypothetical protein